MVEIDGAYGCFSLTLVPDSLANDSFFRDKESECAKIPEAKMIRVDGYKNCWYFELIDIGEGL